MSDITLSIITPSFNQSDFIEKNIDSVFSQSDSDIEHIIVDGGSEDGTVEKLRKFESKYNLRWISESDRGQTHALNKGLNMANGEWIGWQNSDDYYLPGAFENFRMALRKNPQADAIYGDLVIVDESETLVTRKFMTRPSKFIQRYWSLFASNQALFVRKTVFDEISPLNEDLTYTMDAELTWELLSNNYKLVRVPEELGAFRIQPDAKTYSGVENLQRKELQTIYGSPWYEQFFPQFLLQNCAKITKFCYLMSDLNIEALSYNIQNKYSNIME